VRALRDGATRSLLWRNLLLFLVAAVGAVVVVAATSILALDGRPANLAETNGSISPFNSKRTRRYRSLPVHRSILAVDIEGSTRRTNPVKEELRDEVYRLVVEALCVTGIGNQHHDPFTDRGDGLLVLLHPVDELPKPVLLSHLIPALAGLLAAYNSRISPADQPRILRLRAVIHAGEVHRDGNGPFGEDLDVAFRLLDAPRFKAELKNATVPFALVASDYIYQSVIKHGYQGIDDQKYLPLVSVNVGDQRRKGWVHLPPAGGISAVPPLPQAS
jgi:class 3 adenylate cyclase